MKPLITFLVTCSFCVQSYATRPYSPKVFASDSFTYAVGFAWPDQNGKVLMIRSIRKTSLFSLEELGISTRGEVSTAGHRWCQNSIGYVTRVKIAGEDSTSFHQILYFRHRDGHEIAIDVNSSKLINLSSILDMDKLNKHTISEATKLLNSKNPKDRQTGAIHLGQLQASAYLPELKKQLNDDAYFTQVSKNETNKVYYVKEAAEKAIELINKKKS